jgi:ferrochelatase
MDRTRGGETFSHGEIPKTGILLTNLGTPDAPTAAALRRYLAEFLWDPRVVEIPRPLWWLILHGVILRVRPAKSAAAYAKVWSDDGSPLLAMTKKQAAAVEATLKERIVGPLKVEVGMRYGNPSIESALLRLRDASVRRILVFPLYPQYSAATVASTYDAVFAAIKHWRWVPGLRFVSQYHDDPRYIESMAASIRDHWQRHGQNELLVFSFHGMPRRTLLAGDPYHCHCQKSARLIAEALSLHDDQWRVVFQSRFGKEEWLQPYADKTLASLPGEGIRKVDVVCPGFSADCLETLEEMAMQNKETFIEAGGEEYSYIPALNDRSDHVDALVNIIMNNVQGWPETALDWDEGRAEHEAQQTLARARAMGAER